MTIRYVFSGANGGNKSGVDWNNAYTTLSSAVMNPGDVIYVAHTHNEVTAQSGSIVSNGSSFAPVWVYCVLMSAPPTLPTYADLRTTAKITVTQDLNMSISGAISFYGITFIAGNSTGNPYLYLSGGSGQAGNWIRFQNCSLQIGSTGPSARIASSGGYSSVVELIGTTLSFKNVAQAFDIGCTVKWRDIIGAVVGTIPNTLFLPSASRAPWLECIGVDLSMYGAGKTIVGADALAFTSRFKFSGCKLSAAGTLAAAPLSHGSTRIDAVRSGADFVNYGIYSRRMSGWLTEETTIVRATGGVIAWRVITTANCNYTLPFECPPIAFWCASGAAITATIEGVWGGAAVPLDSDIWLDVEYLGSATSPLGSFVNDGTANLLTAPANQSASVATWGGSTTKFKLNVTFTPQQAGLVYARVKIGKPSSTFYIDPIVTLT